MRPHRSNAKVPEKFVLILIPVFIILSAPEARKAPVPGAFCPALEPPAGFGRFFPARAFLNYYNDDNRPRRYGAADFS